MQKFSDINWESWLPTEKAVLTYIVQNNQVLLIHKKSGLGAGLINAPGGRIESHESAKEAAVRECREEVNVTPLNLKKRGTLRFQFTDGYKLEGTLFLADSLTGTPSESSEASPFWSSLYHLPFDKMWEDDLYWLPQLLLGLYVEGDFLFEKERMLGHRIAVAVPEPSSAT